MKTTSHTSLPAESPSEVLPAATPVQPKAPVPDPTVPPDRSVMSFGGWPTRAGKIRPAVLLWALGVPIPLVLLFFLIRGCRA